ncbi:hypothetical protein [Staphylococcus phage vB_SurM-PSU4]|nr:hypothetical protein [Staphylococcus phage vB_SurM-PSU4]
MFRRRKSENIQDSIKEKINEEYDVELRKNKNIKKG